MTRKNFICIVAVAAMATMSLASCSSRNQIEAPIAPASIGTPLSFSAYAAGDTRAMTKVTSLETSGFYLVAYKDAQTEPYFPAEHYKFVTDKYVPDGDPKYWPADDGAKLSFYAVNVAVVELTRAADKTVSFPYEANFSEVDLVAAVKADQTKPATPTDIIQLDFAHLLTFVPDFKLELVSTLDAGCKVNVKSVVIKNKKNGVYTVGAATPWDVTAGEENTIDLIGGKLGTVTLDGTTSSVNTELGVFIPQEAPQLVVAYQVVDDAGKVVRDFTDETVAAADKAGGFTANDDQNAKRVTLSNWVPASQVKYVVKLSVDLTPIQFTASVATWGEVETIEK